MRINWVPWSDTFEPAWPLLDRSGAVGVPADSMKETNDKRPRTVVQRTYEIQVPGPMVGSTEHPHTRIEISIAQEDQHPPTMFFAANANIEQLLQKRLAWDAFKKEIDAVWKAWDTDRSTVTTEKR